MTVTDPYDVGPLASKVPNQELPKRTAAVQATEDTWTICMAMWQRLLSWLKLQFSLPLFRCRRAATGAGGSSPTDCHAATARGDPRKAIRNAPRVVTKIY
jgi:hypothetical protein